MHIEVPSLTFGTHRQQLHELTHRSILEELNHLTSAEVSVAYAHKVLVVVEDRPMLYVHGLPVWGVEVMVRCRCDVGCQRRRH